MVWVVPRADRPPMLSDATLLVYPSATDMWSIRLLFDDDQRIVELALDPVMALSLLWGWGMLPETLTS